MSAWAIHLPHRGERSAPLSTVAEAARHLPQDEDRQVCRQLVLDWRLGGLKTVGDALDLVAALEPLERRALLDSARTDCGLPSTAEVDAAQPKPLTVALVNGGSFPSCPAPGCDAAPVRMGIFYTPDVRKWWCPNHEDQAAPGDLLPRGSGLTYSPSGSIIEVDPADDERDRAREESRRAQLEAEAADRAVEAAELRASKEAGDAAHRRELPAYFRETP
jgi:hypothetical protein